MHLVFEWDPRKDQANVNNHRIAFAEAMSVFGDPLACFTELEESRVRIISSRRATRREQHDYEEHITP